MPAGDSYSSAPNGRPTITRTVTKQVVPFTSSDLVDPDTLQTKKHEEWTTSKRVVNHKTKQVETRVQRQLVLEDGRVVADSGPQVTTKTKEDVRVEESENSEHKTTGDDPPPAGYTVVPGSAQVISEKTESKQTMTETKEENRQMHDEKIKDLSGEELHQRIIVAPDDTNFGDGFCNFPGRLTHFSSRSQKVVDKEEVKEVSELKDGEVSTETTRTHHHEEAYDDEVPEEEAEEGMVPERSAETSRKIQYFTNPRDFESATEQLKEESRKSYATLHKPPTFDNHEHNGNEVPAVTHKWLDDHFGSKTTSSDAGSDRHETTRTRSGGNRITIEMTGNRSSPSELSPTDSIRKYEGSRESTLRNRSNYERSDWSKNAREQSPSPPYPSSSLSRNHLRPTHSPFEVSSSSGSSRSKTPVKTFYLGEENTYNKSQLSNGMKKKNNRALADILKSNLSFNETSNHNTFTRSDSSSRYDSHRNNEFRSSTPKYKTPESTLIRNGTHHASPIYSNVKKPVITKNIQVSMSDEDEVDHYKANHFYKEQKSSNYHDRSSTTLPRNMKTYNYSKSLLTPITTSNPKHYKSSESLLSPNYSNYSSSFDYGSTNSFKYADHRASPVYSPSGSSTLKPAKNHNKDWGSHVHYNDSYSTNRSNRSEYKSREKNDSFRKTDIRNSYETTNGKRNGYSPKQSSWNGTGYSSYKTKTPTSPPESGYQSPLPSSPPYSPPPRLIKVFNSDHYGSSSSISPPDSPRHMMNTASIKRSAAFPSGNTPRSKSSGDLRSPSRLLPSPTTFSPLSSPLELKTMGENTDRQKYYRVKPGDDGRSVVVQVRDWQGR